MANVALSEIAIRRALPLVSEGLAKYIAIQSSFGRVDVANGREFQRRFNGFYRIRRGSEWQKVFYLILSRQKASYTGFADVLDQLHRSTGRIEASFASKLVATVDPALPVIDSIVLKNVGLRLLGTGSPELRMERAVQVHSALSAMLAAYLVTPTGRYLVKQFRRRYPKYRLTRIKMLDLVMWQTRPSRGRR